MSPWLAAILGSGATLLLTAPRHQRRHRRIYRAALCTQHGLCSPSEAACPKCGGNLSIIRLVRMRRRR